MRTRVACAEQAGIEVVAVLHDAAASGTDAAAASHAVRDVVASVRTSRPLASLPRLLSTRCVAAPIPRVQRIGGDVTTRGPTICLSYTGSQAAGRPAHDQLRAASYGDSAAFGRPDLYKLGDSSRQDSHDRVASCAEPARLSHTGR
jgi:hypothetical protein